MIAAIDHSHCIANEPPGLAAHSWTQFLHDVADVLERVLRHGRAFVVVARTDLDTFVQLAVTAERDVHAEAAGSSLRPECCPGRHQLTAAQSNKLTSLGWHAPAGDKGPLLWSRPLDERWHSPAALYSELFVRTLAEVFDADGPEDLTWRFGNMPRAGGVSRAA